MNKSELQNQYNTLIKEYQALKLTRKGNPDLTLEKHHILPSSLGGSNDPNNLVMLTAAAHFEAHKLLADIHNNSGPMQQALWITCNTMAKKGVEISAKDYEETKKAFVKSITGKNSHHFGVLRSKETRQKISNALKGRSFSEAHIESLRIANTGKSNPNCCSIIYTFKHESGETFTGTRYDFRHSHEHISESELSRLIKYTNRTAKGWRLLQP